MLSPLDQAIPNWGAPTLQGFDMNNVADGQRISGQNNRQFVRFYVEDVPEVYATKTKETPNGETQVVETAVRRVKREMVEIVTPGDKNIVNDFAQDYHRREFWAHYKAFRDGRTAPMGTPIDQVQFVPPSIATELLYLGCQTLEQLADGSDDLVNRIANGWQLREFARAHCKSQKDASADKRVIELESKLEEMRAIVAGLQSQKNIEVQEVPAVRGRPGRKPKNLIEGTRE